MTPRWPLLLLAASLGVAACKSEPARRAARTRAPDPVPIEVRPEPPEPSVIGWDPQDTATMPAATILAHSSSMTAFARLVSLAQLDEELWGQGPVTLLVPTDAAFAAQELERLDALAKPAQRDALRGFIRAHVVRGRLSADQLLAAPATTLAQAQLARGRDARGPTVGGAHLLRQDIPALDGVLHLLDSPLVTPPPAPAPTSPAASPIP